MSMSKLIGWDYIKSLMYACPECGQNELIEELKKK